MLALALLYIGTVFLSYLPFLIAERFRIPLLPYIFLFGAFGVWRVALAVTERRWARALKMITATAAIALICRYPIVNYESNRAWWHTDRAVAMAAAGDMGGAAREYRAALMENPGFVDAHIGLANTLAVMGRYDEAIGHFQTVIRQRPKHVAARIGFAAALSLSGNPTAAVPHLREVLASSPRSPQAHFELGRALGLLGKNVEAEAELREALHLSADYAPARLNLGLLLAQKGDHTGAIREYRLAMRLDPRISETYVYLGVSLCALDSLTAGNAYLEQAAAARPGDAQISEQIASQLFRSGQMTGAEHWYRRALHIDSQSASTHANLALTLANLRRFPEAISEMQVAMQLDPANRNFPKLLQQIQAVAKQTTQ